MEKKGEPFTDQTDGGGCGFMLKALRVETQQPGSSRPTSQLTSSVRWMCSASFTLNSPNLLACPAFESGGAPSTHAQQPQTSSPLLFCMHPGAR